MARELKRILAVDDEAFIRELLVDFLTFDGYDVAAAENGEDALKIIEEMKPHLVIMDIKMPGLSGLEVLRQIKATHKDIGVIMLSAFGDSATIQEARSLGADFYLQKPVDLRRLKEMLRTWKETSDRGIE